MVGEEAQRDVGEHHRRHRGEHRDDGPPVDADQCAVEGGEHRRVPGSGARLSHAIVDARRSICPNVGSSLQRQRTRRRRRTAATRDPASRRASSPSLRRRAARACGRATARASATAPDSAANTASATSAGAMPADRREAVLQRFDQRRRCAPNRRAQCSRRPRATSGSDSVSGHASSSEAGVELREIATDQRPQPRSVVEIVAAQRSAGDALARGRTAAPRGRAPPWTRNARRSRRPSARLPASWRATVAASVPRCLMSRSAAARIRLRVSALVFRQDIVSLLS